ncbi:HAD family phosphatase [Acidisphaera sp. S103]|uniref:HAD family hydrolase n=1 Tax=Acidisphaera sp. S103 TaxID=1747223 RepID=UPI0020B15D72|nr:HAD family phosphatase [Acidisphaera sp. S103]
MRPAAVIFDMDGLIFDSEALYRDAILLAARELGHAFTVDDFMRLVGRPWAMNQITMRERVGPSADLELFRSTWIGHYEIMRDKLVLKAGVTELLNQLDILQLPRAICTSSGHADVQRNLRLHKLTGRFDAIVAAGDYQFGKPAADPFLRAAEVLGVAAADCLALEDSHNGVRAAAAAGMRTVMVPDLLPPTDEIARLCEWIAPDLHDVCARLAEWRTDPGPSLPGRPPWHIDVR